MGNKHDKICEELKKYEYYLNKGDTVKTNLFTAYLDGYKITKPRVQAIFRNIVKSVDPDVKVSFNKTFGYIPVIHINKFE